MTERRPPANVIKFPTPKKAEAQATKYLEIARKLIVENATSTTVNDIQAGQVIRGSGNIQIRDARPINQTAVGDNNLQIAAPISRLLKRLNKVQALLEKKQIATQIKKTKL